MKSFKLKNILVYKCVKKINNMENFLKNSYLTLFEEIELTLSIIANEFFSRQFNLFLSRLRKKRIKAFID